MINIIILGAGGHAKEVYFTIKQINFIQRKYNLIGFFDDLTERTELFDLRVIKRVEDFSNDNVKVVFGVGTPDTKSTLIDKFKEKGFKFETIAHPTSLISEDADIEEGAVIQSYCIINPGVRIMRYFTCNDHVQIGHDTFIGDNVHINSNVNITGGAHIGDNAFIGVKATIFRVRIGKNCIIGACSLVNKDIPDYSKVKGIPATYTSSDGKITFGTT